MSDTLFITSQHRRANLTLTQTRKIKSRLDINCDEMEKLSKHFTKLKMLMCAIKLVKGIGQDIKQKIWEEVDQVLNRVIFIQNDRWEKFDSFYASEFFAECIDLFS